MCNRTKRVLSPSTESWDREGKWECYQEIESLRGYLMVWQDRRQVAYRGRQDSGWEESEAKDGKIQVPALDLTIEIAEVYRGIAE